MSSDSELEPPSPTLRNSAAHRVFSLYAVAMGQDEAYRLLALWALPHLERVVYLDPNSLVTGDISRLLDSGPDAPDFR